MTETNKSIWKKSELQYDMLSPFDKLNISNSSREMTINKSNKKLMENVRNIYLNVLSNSHMT